MGDLLPHFEGELASLRALANEFARRHPTAAAHLLMHGETGDDPHVERMFQSFALLAARVHDRLEDDFSPFTDAYLQVLYPHFVRPFPSCAIACFGPPPESESLHLARGTALKSNLVRGVECSFRTAYALNLLAVRVAGVSFRGAVAAPRGTIVDEKATCALAVTVELTADEATWASLGAPALRVYLDGDAAQVSTLRETLCHRVQSTYVQTAPDGSWARGGRALPRSVGFADDEALIDCNPHSHAAYRLLTEYFAFPQKFNFVDLPLPPALLASEARTATLHYLLSGLRADGEDGRRLSTVSEKNLRLGCTPIVNLFSQIADPIKILSAGERYALLSGVPQGFAYEVYSVDKVHWLQMTPEGETALELQAFHSLRHEQLLPGERTGGRYWLLHHDALATRQSPGHEVALSIVDIDLEPAVPQTESLSVEITATNRDLPRLLSIDGEDGQLSLTGSQPSSIRLISQPTRSLRFEHRHGARWRLISHLSLNHLMFTARGIDALKEMLRLYDLPRSGVAQRQIDGLLAIDQQPAIDCRTDDGYTYVVRGTEIHLSVDPAKFVESGLHLFAQVLSYFAALCAHTNSFIQLKLVSSSTGQELIVCPRHKGLQRLL